MALRVLRVNCRRGTLTFFVVRCLVVNCERVCLAFDVASAVAVSIAIATIIAVAAVEPATLACTCNLIQPCRRQQNLDRINISLPERRKARL